MAATDPKQPFGLVVRSTRYRSLKGRTLDVDTR